MIRAFVDGSSGTTGLRILDRLRERKDIQLYTLPEELRKDPSARRDALNRAEVAFLCLPDDAAREAVEMVSNPDTVVIDTSTAHRVSPAWTYGFPEVNGLRQQIQSSCRIANPGCHATGFISLVVPLIGEGAISPDARLSCFSLTGYSGGGKKMIAEYEASGRDPLLDAPRQYALGQRHKHLPEMRIVSGLRFEPVFSPVVAPFYAGMEVTAPLFADQLRIPVSSLPDLYRAYYDGSKMIQLTEAGTENGFCSAAGLSGRDSLEITVTGNEERILLIARFDNLGKGASGAAIQNMNLRFGLPEETGLCLS